MSERASRVAVVSRPGLAYPPNAAAPFDPPGAVYGAVEDLFRTLGLDRARAGTPEWNPLGDVIAPGDRVVVKPNFVTNRYFHEELRGDRLDCSSTHGSVLRPVLDYAVRALRGRGRVDVVDTPVEGCDLEAVVDGLGVRATIERLRARAAPIDFLDLRHFRVVPTMALDDVRRFGRSWNLGLLVRRSLPGDPRGYQVVTLDGESAFEEVPERLPHLCFHRSHPETPRPHHRRGRHEYSIPRTVLEADVILNLPKLKTHKKTGITLAQKAVIGLTNEKYWLPHYTQGTPAEGGDELPERPPLAERIEARLSRLPLPGDHSLIARAPRLGAGALVTDGSWHGNDTVWRTIADLDRVVLRADRDGVVRDRAMRRMLIIADGIVAGEGEGPLGATPRSAGLLIGGADMALVDLVGARAMGFDPDAMPMIRRALVGPFALGAGAGALEEVWDGPRLDRPFVTPKTWPALLRR